MTWCTKDKSGHAPPAPDAHPYTLWRYAGATCPDTGGVGRPVAGDLTTPTTPPINQAVFSYTPPAEATSGRSRLIFQSTSRPATRSSGTSSRTTSSCETQRERTLRDPARSHQHRQAEGRRRRRPGGVLRTLAASEEGFGLIELLIAMTVMVIAIMALVAGFSSGMVALNRASRASTAATVADIQMEGYRKVKYTDASLVPTCVRARRPPPSAWFRSPACRRRPTAAATQSERRFPSTAPSGRSAGRFPSSPSCAGAGAARPAKLVTIVVYDPSTSQELFRESSTFDQATG